MKTLLQANNISFGYVPDEELFKNLDISIIDDQRIGLVGINGIGKTTLLKLLAGAFEPIDGSIQRESSIYYMKQTDFIDDANARTVRDFIFDAYENWWEVIDILNTTFKTDIDVTTPITQVSGGEMMKLKISLALAHNPGVLFLDEPTNHLDIIGIDNLIKTLLNFKGGIIVISHDIYFLDKVTNNTYELTKDELIKFGGVYSEYSEYKKLQTENKMQAYEMAKRKIKQIETEVQKQKVDNQMRQARNMKKYKSGSIDGFQKGFFKDKGGNMQKSLNTSLQHAQESAEKELDANEVNKRKLAFINIKNTGLKSGKTLINANDIDVDVEGKELIKQAKLNINYGDRFLITGKNGSGKSTLVKTLLGQRGHLDNLYVYEDLNYVYIDQNYSFIDRDLNMIENFSNYNSEISDDLAKQQLGKYQFKLQSEMQKKTRDLSGGELARLSLAIATAIPSDLFVLDEPTNNVDVDTVETLTEALNNFSGGLILISHDVNFISKLNIEKFLVIKNKRLKDISMVDKSADNIFEVLREEL